MGRLVSNGHIAAADSSGEAWGPGRGGQSVLAIRGGRAAQDVGSRVVVPWVVVPWVPWVAVHLGGAWVVVPGGLSPVEGSLGSFPALGGVSGGALSLGSPQLYGYVIYTYLFSPRGGLWRGETYDYTKTTPPVVG